MKEILTDILNTEKQVEETLHKVQEKASQIKAETEKEATSQITAARNRAQELVLEARNRAKTEGEQVRQESLKKVTDFNDHFIDQNKKEIDVLIKEIVNIVTKTDL
jgi:vacuolar-type H+-ATPase subunit H